MLQSAKALAREGGAVIWLKKGEKRPVDNGWTRAPRASEADLEATYRPGYNVGVRLGEPSEIDDGLFLHVLDIDVKGGAADEDEAYDALADILPEWEKFPYVESGRGGGSAHIYLAVERPLTKATLAHSAKKVEWIDGAGKKHSSWAWEIQLLGTGQQVVLPPSIHPDTGREYKWGRKIDFDDLDSIIIEPDRLAARDDDERPESASRSSTRDSDSGRSLSDIVKNKKLENIDEDRAWEILEGLPFDEWCESYDGWLKVGMALHHQFDGDATGLDLWHDFSERADNYDADALDDKWKSFGKDKGRRPVRFATLIQAAVIADEKEMHGLDSDWNRTLDRTEDSTPKATAMNIRRILMNDSRFASRIAFNEFTRKRVFRKPPGKFEGREKDAALVHQLEGPLWHFTETEKIHGLVLHDDHVSEIRTLLSERRIFGGWFKSQPTKLDITDAIAAVSRASPFHPVKEFLESVTWDGEERLETLFIDWLGLEDTEYARQVALVFMLAAIARIYTPGIKFDCAPILEGPQGIGKSTFIRYLARDWFVELKCGFDDPKRIVETLAGRWIAELPELSQFGKSDVETVKAFFSAQSDVVRKAYAREEEEVLRQSVYMGSSNNDQYLRDETGNRRFWPLACRVEKIDLTGFKKIVPQLWAEAMVRYEQACDAAGSPERLFLDLKGAAATDAALKLQDSRRIETEADIWAGVIEEWMNTPVRQSELEGNGSKFDKFEGDDPLVKREICCIPQVWEEALRGRSDNLGRGQSNRVKAAILKVPGMSEIGPRKFPTWGSQRAFRIDRKRRRALSDLI